MAPFIWLRSRYQCITHALALDFIFGSVHVAIENAYALVMHVGNEEQNEHECIKGAKKTHKLTRTHAANTLLMQREHTKGAVALCRPFITDSLTHIVTEQ